MGYVETALTILGSPTNATNTCHSHTEQRFCLCGPRYRTTSSKGTADTGVTTREAWASAQEPSPLPLCLSLLPTAAASTFPRGKASLKPNPRSVAAPRRVGDSPVHRYVCPPQRYIRRPPQRPVLGINTVPVPHHHRRRSPSPRGRRSTPGAAPARRWQPRHGERRALRGLTQPPRTSEPHPPGKGPQPPRGQSPPPRHTFQPHPSPLSSGPARHDRPLLLPPARGPSRRSHPHCRSERDARSAPPGRRQDAGPHHGGGWRWILWGGGVTAMAAATALSRWRAQSGRKRTLTSTAPLLYDGAGRGAEPAHPALKTHAQPCLSGPQRPVDSMVGRAVPPGRDHVAAHRGCTGGLRGSCGRRLPPAPAVALPWPQRGGSPPHPLPVTRAGTARGIGVGTAAAGRLSPGLPGGGGRAEPGVNRGPGTGTGPL